MTSAPHAPWRLLGEAVVGLARWRGQRGPLPAGFGRLPGPCVVSAARFTDSPVGPYLKLAVAEPAHLGIRPGWCLTTVVVDNPDARVGGVLNWGFPASVGTLRWFAQGDERELLWEERDFVVRGRGRSAVFPFLVPLRGLQHRSDGPLVVPARARGMARPARVSVQTYPGDELAGLGGGHPGIVVHGLRFLLQPARHPSGLTAPLRAPVTALEPALLRD